jgi:hypothetical protein
VAFVSYRALCEHKSLSNTTDCDGPGALQSLEPMLHGIHGWVPGKQHCEWGVVYLFHLLACALQYRYLNYSIAESPSNGHLTLKMARALRSQTVRRGRVTLLTCFACCAVSIYRQW